MMLRKALRTLQSRLVPFELDWIQVELSACCAGECLYCPVSRFRGRRAEGFMSMETFRRLEPAFSSADLVFLQGWGEPLLHPGFWELVARARAAGPRVGFTTNATLLDAKNRLALLESGVEIMAVSLAGGTSKTHDHFREGSPLDTVDLHLRQLQKEKGDLGSDLPRVHLAYQLLASNLSELPPVMDLAKGWGVSQVVVSNLDLVLSAALDEEALDSRSELWSEMRLRLDEARGRAEERGIVFQACGFGPNGAEPACSENVLRSCFVSADGRVSPCVMANVGLDEGAEAIHRFRGNDYPLHPLVFGNIHERSLEEIWRSEVASDFRRVFRERIWRGRKDTKGLPGVCKHCYKLYKS